MAFLKIGDLELRKTYNYSAEQVEYAKTLRTASKRVCKEVIGYKWEIAATYDYFGENERVALINALKGGTLQVEFYNSNSGGVDTGSFLCTKFPVPKIAKFKGAEPVMWHDVSFTLEEV